MTYLKYLGMGWGPAPGLYGMISVDSSTSISDITVSSDVAEVTVVKNGKQ